MNSRRSPGGGATRAAAIAAATILTLLLVTLPSCGGGGGGGGGNGAPTPPPIVTGDPARLVLGDVEVPAGATTVTVPLRLEQQTTLPVLLQLDLDVPADLELDDVTLAGRLANADEPVTLDRATVDDGVERIVLGRPGSFTPLGDGVLATLQFSLRRPLANPLRIAARDHVVANADGAILTEYAEDATAARVTPAEN